MNQKVQKFVSNVKNTDGSFESGDFDISKDDFSCGCVGEPEYNEEELKSMEFSDDTKSNSDEEENYLNSHRQENLYWSKCLHSTVMPTFIKKCVAKSSGIY